MEFSLVLPNFQPYFIRIELINQGTQGALTLKFASSTKPNTGRGVSWAIFHEVKMGM